jgi:hypothetical protein
VLYFCSILGSNQVQMKILVKATAGNCALHSDRRLLVGLTIKGRMVTNLAFDSDN